MRSRLLAIIYGASSLSFIKTLITWRACNKSGHIERISYYDETSYPFLAEYDNVCANQTSVYKVADFGLRIDASPSINLLAINIQVETCFVSKIFFCKYTTFLK